MRRKRKTQGEDSSSVSVSGILDEIVKEERHHRPPPTGAELQRERWSPARAVVEYDHDGRTPEPEPAHVQSTVFGVRDTRGEAAGAWRIGWTGRALTFGSAATVLKEREVRSGGVPAEYRDAVPRGFVPGGGSWSVAEIAVVGNAEYVFWLRFLNEAANQVVRVQVIGFDEPRLITLANSAGIHYRRYRLDVATAHIPVLRSGDYFPGWSYNLWTTGHAVPRQEFISGR